MLKKFCVKKEHILHGISFNWFILSIFVAIFNVLFFIHSLAKTAYVFGIKINQDKNVLI